LADAVARSRREPTVVIAHPSDAVVEILAEELPRISDRGVGIYPVSEVLAHLRAQAARG
jgi:polysaccharide deacetylase 2 family uncharacterized protein YibQ